MKSIKLYNNSGRQSSVCLNINVSLEDLRNDRYLGVEDVQREFGVGMIKAREIMKMAGYTVENKAHKSSLIALQIAQLREQIERSEFHD